MYKFTHDIITRWIQGLLLHTVRHPYLQHKNSKSLCTRYFICSNKQNKEVTKDMIWNDLPLNIRQSQSLASLKYRFKALPITQQLTDKLDKSGIVLYCIVLYSVGQIKIPHRTKRNFSTTV